MQPKFSADEKVLCYHGPLLYEAKILKHKKEGGSYNYFVHYQVSWVSIHLSRHFNWILFILGLEQKLGWVGGWDANYETSCWKLWKTKETLGDPCCSDQGKETEAESWKSWKEVEGRIRLRWIVQSYAYKKYFIEKMNLNWAF